MRYCRVLFIFFSFVIIGSMLPSSYAEAGVTDVGLIVPDRVFVGDVFDCRVWFRCGDPVDGFILDCLSWTDGCLEVVNIYNGWWNWLYDFGFINDTSIVRYQAMKEINTSIGDNVTGLTICFKAVAAGDCMICIDDVSICSGGPETPSRSFGPFHVVIYERPIVVEPEFVGPPVEPLVYDDDVSDDVVMVRDEWVDMGDGIFGFMAYHIDVADDNDMAPTDDDMDVEVEDDLVDVDNDDVDDGFHLNVVNVICIVAVVFVAGLFGYMRQTRSEEVDDGEKDDDEELGGSGHVHWRRR